MTHNKLLTTVVPYMRYIKCAQSHVKYAFFNTNLSNRQESSTHGHLTMAGAWCEGVPSICDS